MALEQQSEFQAGFRGLPWLGRALGTWVSSVSDKEQTRCCADSEHGFWPGSLEWMRAGPALRQTWPPGPERLPAPALVQ